MSFPADDTVIDALAWDDTRDAFGSNELTEKDGTEKSRLDDSLDRELRRSEDPEPQNADDLESEASQPSRDPSSRDSTEEIFSQLGADFDPLADWYEGIE